MNQEVLTSINHRERNNLAYDSVILSLNLSKLFYDIKFEGEENIPKQGPAIILPKHQCYSDGLLISWMVKKTTGRRLRFFIKSSLPDFVESLGGIKFVTPIDYKKLKNEIGDENAKNYCREFNSKSYSLLESYLNEGDMILLFPEGKLSPKQMSPIKTGGLKYFQNLQDKIPERIPLVPFGIEYGPLYKGRFCLPPNKIRIRAGTPRYFNGDINQLAEDLQKDFRKLCNI